MKTALLVVIIAVVVVVGGVILMRNSSNQPTASVSPTDSVSVTATPTDSPVASVSPSTSVSPGKSPTPTPTIGLPKITVVTVTGGEYFFNPSEIRVKKGTTVKIIYKNSGGVHDWVIDQFNARTPRIQSGQTAEIQFIADKIGTFEYYCSVGNHRAMGMKGNLIVE